MKEMNDLISRKAVIDTLELDLENDYIDVTEFLTFIKQLPSAEPERKSMVWNTAKHRPAYEIGICSCGYVLSVLQRDFVYCPMCGAKLEWE